MTAKDHPTTIVGELTRKEAFSPENAVDQHAVRQTLGMLMNPFEAAVADLADKGVIGVVMGELYLKQ